MLKRLLSTSIIAAFLALTSCAGDDSEPTTDQNPPERITEVELTFSPTGGGDDIVVTARNLNAAGFQDFRATDEIVLEPNQSYILDIGFTNSLDPNNEIDMKSEIQAEARDHKLLFIWQGALFSSPTGNGNADVPTDIINYNDFDEGGLPLGLSTNWTTGNATNSDVEFLFRVLLMHQPPDNNRTIKSLTSGINDGIRDFNIAWRLAIR